MAVTTMVVTGKWLRPDGTPATGRVEFYPSDTRATNGGSIVDRTVVAAVLDATGSISMTLIRLTGGYEVREYITGSSIKRYALVDAVGPVDLSTLTM